MPTSRTHIGATILHPNTKVLDFQGLFVFLGVQNTPLSPLHLFLKLLVLNLRLYRTFEKRCDVNDESTVCYFPCGKVNNFMNITNNVDNVKNV